MTRNITFHKANGLNEAIKIEAIGEPGQGEANHLYEMTWGEEYQRCIVNFQLGPIKEAGVNGVSNEALLAIVEDRLKSFQEGPYACRENAQALLKLQEAMMWLHRRTHERMQRGVEGTHQK